MQAWADFIGKGQGCNVVKLARWSGKLSCWWSSSPHSTAGAFPDLGIAGFSINKRFSKVRSPAARCDSQPWDHCRQL